jgi:D-xylose transport system ATP-binding protein
MKILSGVIPYESYSGKVKYNNEEIQFNKGAIREAIEKGIAIVHQELALIPKMSIGENVYLGRETSTNIGIDWDQLYANTSKLLEEYEIDMLNIPLPTKIGDLSVGQQQMVEITKALSENAKVLILDEPTSALTTAEVDTLMNILDKLRNKGVTCIYITHKLEEFFRICDRITVLRDGQFIACKEIKELEINEIISLMVGRDLTERYPPKTSKIGNEIMSVEHLTVRHPDDRNKDLIKDVSFTLRKGEILGIAGLMGSGRTETVMSIFGELGPIVNGVIMVNGEPVKHNSSADAIKNGIGLVTEDRKLTGLILEQSILKNISLASLTKYSNIFNLDLDQEYLDSMEYAKALNIKAPHLETTVGSLSGGNQQKVVIAKWLMTEPKILILDEPTRGIDVGAKYEIYKIINNLAERGVAIIMISSELPEILGMSDRIMVMHSGSVTGILDKKDATQEVLMSYATGQQHEVGEMK